MVGGMYGCQNPNLGCQNPNILQILLHKNDPN